MASCNSNPGVHVGRSNWFSRFIWTIGSKTTLSSNLSLHLDPQALVSEEGTAEAVVVTFSGLSRDEVSATFIVNRFSIAQQCVSIGTCQ